MELNHILPAADGGADIEDNCIPLCFDCHSDVGHYNPRHPKGKKFSVSELKGHRDRWYEKVARNASEGLDLELREIDRELFAQLRNILRSSGAISFLRSNDFGHLYHEENMQEVWDFAYWTDHPDHEFLDQDVESAKALLKDKVESLLKIIGHRTFFLGDSKVKLRGVPPEWADEKPELFREASTEINDAAEEVWKQYDELIRCGRRKLVVM